MLPGLMTVGLQNLSSIQAFLLCDHLLLPTLIGFSLKLPYIKRMEASIQLQYGPEFES